MHIGCIIGSIPSWSLSDTFVPKSLLQGFTWSDATDACPLHLGENATTVATTVSLEGNNSEHVGQMDVLRRKMVISDLLMEFSGYI